MTPGTFSPRHLYPAPQSLPSTLAVLLFAAMVFSNMVRANDTDHAAVQDVVDELFDAMREKDVPRLEALFHPEARLGLRGAGAWISSVGTSNAYLDEVTYNETVLVDGHLAMAWTPYTLYVDEVLHHCGVDVFVMQRSDKVWKILQLNDTRRSENCPDPRSK